MHIERLLSAPPVVRLHLFAALLALFVGIAQLLRPRGTPTHRAIGWLWVGTMVIVCLSSFGISALMPGSPVFGLSPIHLLSLWTLFALTMGIRSARAGNPAAHARWMSRTFCFALIGAGLFTLLPGRLLYRSLIE